MYDALDVHTNASFTVRHTNYALTFTSATTESGDGVGEVSLQIKIQRQSMRKLLDLLPLFTAVPGHQFSKLRLYAEVPVVYQYHEEADDNIHGMVTELSAKTLWIDAEDAVVTLYVDGTGRAVQLSRNAFISALTELAKQVYEIEPLFLTSNITARAYQTDNDAEGVSLGASAVLPYPAASGYAFALWKDDHCVLAEYRLAAGHRTSASGLVKTVDYVRNNQAPIRVLKMDADGVWCMLGTGWYHSAHEAQLISMTRQFSWM